MPFNASTTNSATVKIPTFNGEDGTFPFFKIKFTAAIYGLGSHYYNAVNGLKPYDECTYSVSQRGITPFKTPSKPRGSRVTFTPARNQQMQQKQEETGADSSSVGEEESKESSAELQRQKALQMAQKHEENYHQISRKVYSVLISCIGDTPIKKLANAGMQPGDGIGAWRLLCEEYESGSSVNQRQLFRQLIDLKMDSKHAKLYDYLYEFRRMTTTLSGMGVDIPEQMLIALLLAGLHEQYGQMVNILNSKADLDLEECYRQLKTYQTTNNTDARTQQSPHSLNGHAASNSGTPNATQGRGRRRDRVMSCYNCQKAHMGGEFTCTEPCRVCGSTEHVRFNCPQRQARQRRREQANGQRQPQHGNAAQNGPTMEQLAQQLAQLQTHMQTLLQQDGAPEGNGSHIHWGVEESPTRSLNGTRRS